jgi:hypothetical protein
MNKVYFSTIALLTMIISLNGAERPKNKLFGSSPNPEEARQRIIALNERYRTSKSRLEPITRWLAYQDERRNILKLNRCTEGGIDAPLPEYRT